MPEPAPLRLGHSPVLPAFPAYRTGLSVIRPATFSDNPDCMPSKSRQSVKSQAQNLTKLTCTISHYYQYRHGITFQHFFLFYLTALPNSFISFGVVGQTTNGILSNNLFNSYLRLLAFF